MNKENSGAAGELSAEQKARISRNFRAAKALLDRKRPRDNDNHFDSAPQKIGVERRVETPVPVGGIKRIPLSDISVNTPSPYPVRSFKLTDSSGCNSNLLPKSHGNFIPRTKVVSNENGIVQSSFTTPIRQIDYGADRGFRGLSARGIESICGVGAVDGDKLFLSSFRTPVTPSDFNGRFRNIGLVHSVMAPDEDKLLLDSFRTPITPPVPSESLEKGIAVKNVELSDVVKDPDEDKLVFDLFRTPVAPSDCDGNLSEGITVRKFEAIYDGLSESKMGVLLAEGIELSLCNTPGRPHDGSSSIEYTVMPDNFYEDFDDSILGEIDTLCKVEQKQNVAGRSSQCNSDDATKSECTEKSSGEDKTNIATVVFEEMLQTDGVMDLSDAGECEVGGCQSSETSEIENMPAEYAKYMQSLNDRQREAACSDISVPLMIVAGPGSGKTSTMVGRVLKLLNEGIGPSHILAMTFTTAAASEMRDRIGAVAGKAKAKELMISTFHSFCLQLCRSHAEKLGRTPEFLLYGQGQQRRAVIEAVRLTENGKSRLNYDSSKPGEEPDAKSNCPQDFKDKSKKWLKFVSQAKASGKNLEKIQKLGDDTGAAILRNYESILKSCNALDYHDLISCSVKLLTYFPEVFKECQESWKAIVIDEFQDTSAMQYGLLRILATHNRITIVGDEDQSIFSFNGADVSGFNSFRKDFQVYKEIRLNKNYRSTRCIVEAASSLIKNNSKRCQLKNVLTDNSSGSKITLKECCNEDAQCAFVVDKILEITSASLSDPGTFGEIAILYRRQVSGKMFQTVFRNRKIPFNIHGVAFYRKKVVRAIMSMLRTTLLGCDDGSFRRVFKALLPLDKEEKKRVIEHIDKVSTIRKCSFISAATDIFSAKISGTFKRGQLTHGRKVLLTLDMISKLVHREQSVSAVVTSVANMIPQRYLLEQRAVLDVDGGKLLNEDNDLRSVLHYLLDDVSEFLKLHDFEMEGQKDTKVEERGCVHILKAFIDYISERETENFRSRRHDNTHSVTLTTIHQSKGLEWDTVFIVKANESEIPLLHEFNGITIENCSSVEEERRLLYVAMTRARKKLFILYILMDSNWQVLQPSRFLKEIPKHLLDVQDASIPETLQTKKEEPLEKTSQIIGEQPRDAEAVAVNRVPDDSIINGLDEESFESSEPIWACNGNDFLKRFITEERAVVSHLFHQWAKKAAFKEPKRLLDKVSFVIDERLRAKKSTHKDVLRSLKSCLRSDEAFQYAESVGFLSGNEVLRWEQIPADKRAYLTREKQEHFQKLRIESAMGSSAPTSKQIAYLQNLGCTTAPTSRLHASRLIEQYKSL